MKDIVFTDDLEIENGDFVVADSTNQHIEHNIRFNPGDILQYPDQGAGINKKTLNSNISFLGIKKRIKRTLEKDSFRLLDFKISNNNIYISAE